MEKKNPYEELFDKFQKILDFVKSKENVPSSDLIIPENTDKVLRKLAKAVESFQRLSLLTVSLANISTEEIEKRLKGVSDQLTPSAKRTIDKGNFVKREIEQLKDKFEKAEKFNSAAKGVEESSPPGPPSERQLTDKQKTQKRRGKFKRIGGDSTWKPL